MKTHTLIWVILLLICSTSMFAEHYYYYHGEKLPLVVNTDSVTIYAMLTNSRKSDLRNSIITSTVPTEVVKQLSVQENIDILSVEYLIGDSSVTQKMSNSFYIKLYEDADTLALKELVEETNTHLLGEIPYVDKWYEIMVANSAINNTLDMSNYFFETGLFADVDPGFVFEVTPNCVSDSNFASQWALPALNACDAWEYTKGDPNLMVAIIDQGIEIGHTELAYTRFVYPYDCHTNQEVATIYGSHGTQVAGVMVANHNEVQLAGITPGVTIIPISHPLDSMTPQAAKELASGISYAWQHGADVINCSWGFHPKMMKFPFLYSRVLENALEDALTYGRNGKGCVVVFAAGNMKIQIDPFNYNLHYPANKIPELLVVGNAQKEYGYYTKADDSSYGQKLDVVAPGYRIHTTTTDNCNTIVSGTSLSAPYVSGIAALILSVRPDLTREEVVDIIESTARDDVFNPSYSFDNKSTRPNGPWSNELGYGLVDAYAAVSSVASVYIQNKSYGLLSDTVVKAHSIYAGNAVTDLKEYGDVTFMLGCDVTYRATNKVVLKPGFHAHNGSKLRIKVDTTLFDPIAPTTSAPQRIAPRSSTMPADEAIITNDMESVEREMIQSTAIYTISGQLLQTIDGGQRDASHLPNGMYILQHRMSDGSMRSEKIANNK